mmetsp:Transcript_45040/g.75138  ORF Transcript_45040/g.75138 Transcript_45040/m.75138 type:complete len:217 (+) Transcript_45040:124-774(+)
MLQRYRIPMSAQLHHRPALRSNQDTFLDPHESQAPPKSNKNLAHGLKWLALISTLVYVLSSKAPQAPSPISAQHGGVRPDRSQARPTIREPGQQFASQASISLSSSISDSQQVEGAEVEDKGGEEKGEGELRRTEAEVEKQEQQTKQQRQAKQEQQEPEVEDEDELHTGEVSTRVAQEEVLKQRLDHRRSRIHSFPKDSHKETPQIPTTQKETHLY